MNRPLWLALGLGTLLSIPGGQAPAPRCLVKIISSDREFHRNDLFGNGSNINYDIAGHVRMRCVGQDVYLNADSVSILSSEYARLYGHTDYRDRSLHFTADTMVYQIRIEKLEARGNVHVRDSASGSTLVGPYLDYWRQVKAVNDSAKVLALLHPTVNYYARPTAAADTAAHHPYRLAGDHIYGFGQSQLSAGGAVTIDRDSIHGTGDSLAVARGKSTVAQLLGKTAALHRAGADSFSMFGREIRLHLEQDTLRDLEGYIKARVVRAQSDLAGDTVTMGFTAGKLSRSTAWARKDSATLSSGGFHVAGDSLVVDSPGELLHSIRVFGRGRIENPVDSAQKTVVVRGDTIAPDSTRNFVAGAHLVALFEQADSAGATITRLRELQAYGHFADKAQSYFSRDVEKDGRITPSINYTVADTILIHMRPGDSTGVSVVQAYGHVQGVQLETASIRGKADSTKRGLLPGGHP
jgi:hypothetical protein